MDLDAELEELAAQQLEEDLMKMNMPAAPSAPVAGQVPAAAPAMPAEPVVRDSNCPWDGVFWEVGFSGILL